MWRGPRTLCVVVTTARQPVYGPDPVVSPCQMVYSVATTLRRWVPYDGGLLWCGAVWFSHSLSARGCNCRWLQEVKMVVSCSPSEVVSSVSTSQSDQPEVFEWSCVRRALISQSNPSALLSCFFFFFLVMASQGYTLIFFCYINRNIIVECCSFKKNIGPRRQ